MWAYSLSRIAFLSLRCFEVPPELFIYFLLKDKEYHDESDI